MRVGLSRVNSYCLWLCYVYLIVYVLVSRENTFLMRWCMTSIWNWRCQYSWVNSDQMRSEVFSNMWKIHYFGFLCIVRILHPTCSHTRPQPEVPKIDGFGARPLGDGKLHPDVLKFRRRFLNQGVGLQAVLTLHLRSTHILRRPKVAFFKDLDFYIIYIYIYVVFSSVW